LDDLAELLDAFGARQIVDVRSIPKSRHNPQFNKDELRLSLKGRGIGYKHIKELGGLRHSKKDSINVGWRNLSFRAYADYMATPEFAKGLQALTELASKRPTVVMCAEALPWRCHRSLIADALTKSGWLVRDILSRTLSTRHRLTPFLRVRKGLLTYPNLDS
jgi:uncharacterized protein (DUF488 family)